MKTSIKVIAILFIAGICFSQTQGTPEEQLQAAKQQIQTLSQDYQTVKDLLIKKDVLIDQMEQVINQKNLTINELVMDFKKLQTESAEIDSVRKKYGIPTEKRASNGKGNKGSGK